MTKDYHTIVKINLQHHKISIVTPSFNQGMYLEETIDSILSQNYPNLEYIIVDGGSRDNSVESIKKYSKYLKFWVSERDRGQSHAINKGLYHAQGEIINWINSDDKMRPGSLTLIDESFKDSSVDVVCGQAFIKNNGVTTTKSSTVFEGDVEHFFALGQIMQPATFWRKATFDLYTPLDESLHFMMDHYIWLRYISQTGMDRIHYIPETLVEILMHDAAKSVNSRQLFDEDRMRIYSSFLETNGLKNRFYKGSTSQKLDFSKTRLLSPDQIKGVDFLIKYDMLFARGAFGEKKNVRIKNITEIFLTYPIRLFVYFFYRRSK